MLRWFRRLVEARRPDALAAAYTDAMPDRRARSWSPVRRTGGRGWLAAIGLGVGIAGIALADAGYRHASAADNHQEPASASTTAPAERLTLAWRDAAGQTHAATIERAELGEFLAQQRAAVAKLRLDTRTLAQTNLAAATGEIFARVDLRVPRYADWYFRYTTKYVLMSRALRAALAHLGKDVTAEPHRLDFIHAIEISLTGYLQQQFGNRVLWPPQTATEIETGYARTQAELNARWMKFRDEQRAQLVQFIAQNATPVDPSTVLGAQNRGPIPPLAGATNHEDVEEQHSFQSGLLKITVSQPRTTGSVSTHEMAKDGGEKDQVAQVMVNLFSTIVDPVAARVGDLVIGAAAGGVVGAMAGGSSVTMVGMTGAVSGAAAIAPVAALFGAAISLGTDFAASKFEESLSRPGFEQGITQIVTAMRDAVDKTLTALLYRHIDSWNADVLADISVDRLMIKR